MSLLFVLIFGIHLSKPSFGAVLSVMPEPLRYNYINFILKGDKLIHLKVVTLEFLLERKYDVDTHLLFILSDRTSKTIGEPIPQLAVTVIYHNYNDQVIELLEFYKNDLLTYQVIKSQLDGLKVI